MANTKDRVVIVDAHRPEPMPTTEAFGVVPPKPEPMPQKTTTATYSVEIPDGVSKEKVKAALKEIIDEHTKKATTNTVQVPAAVVAEHIAAKVAEVVAPKTLDVTGPADAKAKVYDLELFGDPNAWKLICKASSQSEGWMKSTKAMQIEGAGVLVQVSTQQGNWVAEALQYIPGVMIDDRGDGDIQIRRPTWEDGLSTTAKEYRNREFLTEDDRP